MNVFGIVTHL